MQPSVTEEIRQFWAVSEGRILVLILSSFVCFRYYTIVHQGFLSTIPSYNKSRKTQLKEACKSIDNSIVNFGKKCPYFSIESLNALEQMQLLRMCRQGGGAKVKSQIFFVSTCSSPDYVVSKIGSFCLLTQNGCRDKRRQSWALRALLSIFFYQPFLFGS